MSEDTVSAAANPNRYAQLNKILAEHGMEFGDAKMTMDSLINEISGLNTGRDRMAASQFCRTNSFGQNYTELEAMYTENWIAKKAINVVADDMTRNWVEFDADSMKPEQLKELENEEKRLKLRSKVTDAVRWARLYGGSMIMPIFKGDMAESLMTPLDVSRIKAGDLISLNVLEARYVFPTTLVEIDPTSPAYQTPEFYTVAGAPESYIHHTRLIRFDGDPLPRWERQQHRYWGQSVLESARRAVVDAFTSSGLISSMLNEANIDVISIENLAAAIASGKDKVKDRFEAYYRMKSLFNVSLIDANETYGQRQLNFSTLDKIMEMFYVIVSGAFNMPVTKLLGVSPAGLNATGEHDTKNYNVWINTEQESTLSDPLTILYHLIFQNLWSKSNEDFDFIFAPLTEENPNEKAERESKQASTDQIYYEMGVLPAWMIAENLKVRGTYSNITTEYIEQLKADEEAANDELGDGNPFLKGVLPDEADGGSDSTGGTTKEKSEDEPPPSEKDEKAQGTE